MKAVIRVIDSFFLAKHLCLCYHIHMGMGLLLQKIHAPWK